MGRIELPPELGRGPSAGSGGTYSVTGFEASPAQLPPCPHVRTSAGGTSHCSLAAAAAYGAPEKTDRLARYLYERDGFRGRAPFDKLPQASRRQWIEFARECLEAIA